MCLLHGDNIGFVRSQGQNSISEECDVSCKVTSCIVFFQLQKIWEESTCFANDSDKAKIEQIQLQSETGFMEMRLETASRR